MVQVADPLARSTDPRIAAVQEKLGRGLVDPGLSELDCSQERIHHLSKIVCANLVGVLEQWGLTSGAKLHSALIDRVASVEPECFVNLLHHVQAPHNDWGYRGSNPLVRELCRAVMDSLLLENSKILFIDRLADLSERKVIFLANHLSAIDVHAFQHLLVAQGEQGISEKLTAVVGYKTFELPLLSQLSLSFGTLKVPQSASVESGTVEMKLRDLAANAQKVLQASSDRLQAGDKIFVFPEGTRSRTGEMYRCLPAVSRYLRDPDLIIVPVGINGTERILPVDKLQLVPSTVEIAIGKPISSRELFDQHKGMNRAERIMDSIGVEIARLLPSEYRGYYRQK